MQKVLIIDDDPTVAGALSEYFSRIGFEPVVEVNSAEVISMLRIDSFAGIIIDCMIPGINGVDLATKIRQEVKFSKTIILISGIFTDKKFADNSVEKSGANDFLFKPVDLEKLEKYFQKEVDPESSLSWLPKLAVNGANQELFMEELFLRSEVKPEELPLLFSSIKQYSVTTELLIASDRYKYRIKFSNGEMTCLIFNENDNLVKNYLLDRKFCTEADLGRVQFNALNYPEVLVNSVLLSPHLVDSIVETIDFNIFQKLIGDKVVYRLSLLEESNLPKRRITIPHYDNLIFEYCFQGVNSIFLVDYFSSFKDLEIVLQKGYHKILKANPMLADYGPFIEKLKSPIIFNHFVKGGEKAKVIRLIYFLHTIGALKYNISNYVEKDFSEMTTMFSTMYEQVKDLPPDEIFSFFGVNPDQTTKVNKFFKSFAVKYHPDKISSRAPQELLDLSRELFSIVSQAHSIVSDPAKREEYRQSNSGAKAESALKAEIYKEKGQSFIKKGKFSEALPFFEKSLSEYHDDVVSLYYYWCFLKVNKSGTEKVKLIDIYRALDEVGEKDRENELYNLVYGLLLQSDKKFSEAKKYFKKSLEANPNFLPARRELLQIRSQQSKKSKSESGLLSADIGSVVAGFFKKKKKK